MQSPEAAITEGFWLGMDHRFNQRAELLVQVECETKEAYSLGRCQNISETGMLVRTPETFEPTTAVLVRFVLPPPRAVSIEARGTVVRVQPGESMGIQFVELKDRHRAAITAFVEQARKEGRPLPSGG